MRSRPGVGAVARSILVVAAAALVGGCDPACTIAYENHTADVIRLRPIGSLEWRVVRSCHAPEAHLRTGGPCVEKYEAADANGNTVAVEELVGRDGRFPFRLFRVGVGSGECDEPPEAGVYVVVRNLTDAPASLRVNGDEAGSVEPGAERRLGPVPGKVSPRFFPSMIPEVTAAGPEGEALRVGRLSAERDGDAVGVVTVEISAGP